MSTTTTPLIHEAATAIIETRDLCGDESGALQQFQADNRKLSTAEIQEARQLANTLWSRSQQAAGVRFPLNANERRTACRDIESGK